MHQYPSTKKQTQYLQLPYDTSQLQLLQKPSKSKIQIVSYKGVKTIKSIDDRYRKMRVLLVALLVKIFVTYSTDNQERFLSLKRIIYEAKLQSITEQKGIVKQHLLKSIAQQFKQLKIGNNVQHDIIKMFNCVPFFDITIISALEQSNPLMIQNDCQLTLWMDRQMSLKLLWNEETLIYQSGRQLFLIGLGERFHALKDCKSHQCNFKDFKDYLRISIQECPETSGETYYANDCKTGNKLFSQSFFQQQPDTPYIAPTPNLYKTIQMSNSYGSPDTQNKFLNASSYKSVGLFDSLRSVKKDSQRVSDIDILQKQTLKVKQIQRQKTMKLRRGTNKDQKKQGSSLWNLFCCSSDNK